MYESEIQGHSPAWLMFVKMTFALSIAASLAGILFLDVTLMVKGYFAISALFMISSTIIVTKTLRDEHESRRLINRIQEARTSQMLKEVNE